MIRLTLLSLPSALLLACGLSGPVDSGDSADPAPNLGDPNSTDPALACPPWEEGMTYVEYDALLAQLPPERVIAVTVDVWDPAAGCFRQDSGLRVARYWCPVGLGQGQCGDAAFAYVDSAGQCLWLDGFCDLAEDPSLSDCSTVDGCCLTTQDGPYPRCEASPP